MFFAITLPILADDPPAETPLSASSSPAAIMLANPDRVNLQDILSQKPKPSALRLANSDFVISGPIIENLRPHRDSAGRVPLWKRIALLPVRLLTPIPMSMPPSERGRYFKWKGDSANPWMSVSAGDAGNDSMNYLNSEPKSALISVSKP